MQIIWHSNEWDWNLTVLPIQTCHAVHMPIFSQVTWQKLARVIPWEFLTNPQLLQPVFLLGTDSHFTTLLESQRIPAAGLKSVMQWEFHKRVMIVGLLLKAPHPLFHPLFYIIRPGSLHAECPRFSYRGFWLGWAITEHRQPERRSHPGSSTSIGSISSASPAVTVAARYPTSKVPALPAWSPD